MIRASNLTQVNSVQHDPVLSGEFKRVFIEILLYDKSAFSPTHSLINTKTFCTDGCRKAEILKIKLIREETTR